MDSIATELGVSFKASKDEGFSQPTFSMEFLGNLLTTTPVVIAQPTTHRITKAITLIDKVIS